MTSNTTDISGNAILLNNLKIGDNFYVTQTNVPDRWVGDFLGSLPEGYQQVEYIESTGNQYIDTGVSIGAESFDITAKFILTEESINEQHIFST